MKSLSIALVAALVGFAAIYVTLGGPDNASRPTEDANKAKPPAKTGQMAAFVKKNAPEPLPEITFQDGTGKDVTLASFKGRAVLLNLWATWCAPCREEMPALNRLQQALGGDKFEVVALSLDRQGAEASQKFLNDVGAKALKLYIDATAKQGLALKLLGMPTTILIDKEGREVGRLAGSAEWDSEDAKTLIKAVMN